ncbi:MAG: S41 family peptidase [Oscillospiraceae bacterium]|nr:S41 family peptidase [Oscillospiraceae bacterium]
MLTLVAAASALTCLLITLVFLLYIDSRKELHELGTVNQNPQHSEQQQAEAARLEELLRVIENRFIGSFDIEELTNEAMRAAVEALEDDWSYYMTAQEFADFQANSNNRYSGIGVEVILDEDTEGMRVVRVYSDSGADRAGILADDIVTAVDGESIIGLTLPEIRNLLRREIGESAIVTVNRDGNFMDLKVEYSIVFTDPVNFEMLDGNIGYIKLRNFEEGASSRFIAAVTELIDKGAVAFIYDVRSNNGGRVGEVTAILDFLLPEGEIFISVDRSEEENITYSDDKFTDFPAVVLVNVYSFSGAEYFAAMLSEYDYAPSVGEQTTGKNRMQTTIPLSNGGAVHISTGHYLTKNRVSLFDIGGFTPEYVIEMTDDERKLYYRGELSGDLDRQLKKALSLLENTVN